MHFQVFIPDAKGASPELLKAVGLADMTDGADYMSVSGGQGPDGLGGVCVAWRRTGAMQMGMREAGQTWKPSLGDDQHEAGAYWVGLWDDSPATVEDLARKKQLRGEAVALGDGGSWLVPGYQQLPRDVVPMANGECVFEPKPEYRHVMEAGRYWLQKFQGGEATFDYGELFELCCQLLRLNYRIVPEVVSHLRLFDTENMSDVLGAFLGVSFEVTG